MILGNILYGDLVWLRIAPFNGLYRVSIRIEQGGVGSEREFVSWLARLVPAPPLAPQTPLDMALVYDVGFEQMILSFGLRVAFLGYFGFEEITPA
jgi:hypothetical protein